MTEIEQAVPVHVAVSRVMRDMPAVGKNSTNSHSNYKYRSIDDLLAAFNRTLVQHGVVILPQAVSRTAERAGKSNYVTVEMEYTIIGPAGDTLTTRYFGEGGDVGDKATAKAQTAAFKYLMITMFCIPVDDIVDGDKSTPDRARDEREHEDELEKKRQVWREARQRLIATGQSRNMTPEQVVSWYQERCGEHPSKASINDLVAAERELGSAA
ncbi:ERF family protein [Streptomyces sp. NPDC000927]|uniref:ERF family protein n=1 Tax=Streptomyces sp. NPDC000927 TaxID=3154371 RepID=UPI0033188CC6